MWEVLDTVIFLFLLAVVFLARRSTRDRERHMGRANSEPTWNPKEY